MYKTKFGVKISEMLKSTNITIFGLNLCHKEKNLVAHLWADLEGNIDGLIEGMGKLFGEVLGVKEDEAAVELMSQEVIANVDAIGSGTGRRESQVDLVDRLGSRWDFSGRPGCRLQTLLRRQPVPV